MSHISPITPSFVFGYWRPWKENSNLFDSYLDYAKDTSLVKYGADTVGVYISQASKEQIQAINDIGQSIGRGMNVLSNQMADINKSLLFLNRNLDIQLEQQKLSNLLLQNIAELLRVPDSEKERQLCIELGVKFFVNAKKDDDLYADSLEELLKAESLRKQDYFVLHRIGCIYLYAEKFISPEKALEYFLRAAKYASVESDPGALKLANTLAKNFNSVNSTINNSEEAIGLLAAESYEKAAFSAYILGQFENAINYQTKALKYNSTIENKFLLCKYQVRNCDINEAIKNLDECINSSPIMAIAAFKEIDLINEPGVIKLIKAKNDDIDNKINKLIQTWDAIESQKAATVLHELKELLKRSYEVKVAYFHKFNKAAEKINVNINAVEQKIDDLIKEINLSNYVTYDKNKITAIIVDLIQAKDLSLEKMQMVYDNLKKELDADKLQIGSKCAGGIVFYLDKTGKHGLVCTDKDLGTALWGSDGEICATGNGIADGTGMANTKKIVELASWYIEKGWLSNTKTPAPTAARMCHELNHNGYNDWYLPTSAELKLIKKNFAKIKYKHNLNSDPYWSSTEDYVDRAWNFITRSGTANDANKNIAGYVRAVRAF